MSGRVSVRERISRSNSRVRPRLPESKKLSDIERGVKQMSQSRTLSLEKRKLCSFSLSEKLLHLFLCTILERNLSCIPFQIAFLIQLLH